MALNFPQIDPVALALGPIEIRWYALAYIVGFVGGMVVIKHFLKKYPSPYLNKNHIDDLLTWVLLGVIIGGRLGYVFFYNSEYYLSNPLDIPKIWQGGMAFHGGLIGVITAMILFAWKYKIPFFVLSDRVALVTPIGLFFGRIANFINGELFGRTTDFQYAFVFPNSDLPRHASQLYQAATEGLILFIILLVMQRYEYIRNHFGIISGTFLAGYAIFRFLVEFTRQPDSHLGFVLGSLSMGQVLCIPMALAGLGIILYAIRYNKTYAA
jgi:phosphatidylglycerol:prolipoprotein diacylglycerol transferase